MKQFSYKSEHISCINYKKQVSPVVELIYYSKGYDLEKVVLEQTVYFVIAGTFSISYEEHINTVITEGHGFVMAPGSHLTALFDQDVTLLSFRLDGEIRFCERVSLKNLSLKENKLQNNLQLLELNSQIYNFLHTVTGYLSEGFHCEELMKLKTRELLFLLKSYYPKNTLRAFFSPLLSQKISFSEFVLKNYTKVKTVYELAALSPYSVSGFEKEFKKVFGISVYQWMTERKVRLLYHEINATDKPFKQISDEMGFSSLSQFNDYCKKHFGIPPGRMRAEKVTIL